MNIRPTNNTPWNISESCRSETANVVLLFIVYGRPVFQNHGLNLVVLRASKARVKKARKCRKFCVRVYFTAENLFWRIDAASSCARMATPTDDQYTKDGGRSLTWSDRSDGSFLKLVSFWSTSSVGANCKKIKAGCDLTCFWNVTKSFVL